MANVAETEKRTLTLADLEQIESNIVLANVETLRSQLRSVNASDRTIYVNSDESLQLAQKHIVVAERLMATIEARYTELMSHGR